MGKGADALQSTAAELFAEFRRKGISESDLAAATELSIRIHAADWSVFPHRKCPVRYWPSVSPNTIARYIPEGESPIDSYMIFVDGLDGRLDLEELTAVMTHRWSGSEVSHLRGHILDALAVHEVRHRLQMRLAGTLKLWTPGDLPPEQSEDVLLLFGELYGIERQPLEADARIVEYLRMRELLHEAVGPRHIADAVWREPQR